MAESDAKDSSSEEGKGEEEKLGLKQKLLSKPMLIKIGAGLLVVLLSAGGYFFMAVGEEPLTEEITEDGLEEDASEQDRIDEEGIDENIIDTIELDIPEELMDSADSIALEDSVLSDDEQIPTEEGIEFPEISIDDEDVSAETKQKETEAELSKVSKKATKLQSENSRLQQKIKELKAAAERKEIYADPAAKAEASKYIVNRRSEYGDYPSLREPQREPPPEPKWGEFNKISK